MATVTAGGLVRTFSDALKHFLAGLFERCLVFPALVSGEVLFLVTEQPRHLGLYLEIRIRD